MNWIKELSVQRQSLYSNGLIVQTDDCKRVSELIGTMKAKYPEPVLIRKKDESGNWIRERWLILDGWDGLSELKKSVGKWITSVIADAKKYGGEIRTLLPVVSNELDKGDTILIVQNLLLADKHINNAFRSWSTSDRLRSIDSSIVVFVEDASMFPQNVWSKMKIIDVPKSLDHERLRIIKEEQEMMAARPTLDKKDERAAVRILAGMNLDQIDAAVVESMIRHQHVDLGALAKTKGELISNDPSLDIIQRPRFGFESIGGYDALKTRLRDDIILPLRHPEIAEEFNMKSPRGVILFGSPGTGKTVLTKAMSKELNMSVLVLRPENIMSKYVGESERGLKRAFKIADSMAPAILFCDELDRLAKRAGSGSGDAGAQVHREIFSMLLEKLGDEDREWFFVGCTNRIEDIDDAMRRTGRIDSIAPVPFPNKAARLEIFKIHATVKRKLPLANDISFKRLADNKHTYMWSGSDVEQLVIRTAKYVMKDSIKKGGKARKITMEDFETILDSFNVDANVNEALQESIKLQAQKLTNDKRLMDIFEEAQTIAVSTRGEKAKEIFPSKEGDGIS